MPQKPKAQPLSSFVGDLISAPEEPVADPASEGTESPESDPKPLAENERAIDPENPDETFVIEVSKRELALLNLIRSMKGGNIASIDVSQGRIISIKSVSSELPFGDSNVVNALARATDPEYRVFLR